MPARPSIVAGDVWGAALNAHLDVAIDQATGNLKTAAVQAALGGSPPAPSRVGARTKVYDPARCVYNMHQDNMRKWRTALAKARVGTKAARLNCYGDSITDLSITSGYQFDYTGRLRALFAADYGASGLGVMWANDDAALYTYSGANWANLGGDFGPFGDQAKVNPVAGAGTNYFQYGPAVADSFTIYLIGNPTSGKIDFSIDAGAAVMQDTSQAGANAPKLLTVATTNASHTLKGLHTAASNDIYLVGVEATIGTGGVRVTRSGHGGAVAGSVLGGMSGAATGTAGSAPFVFDSIPPDLSVIFLGHNDYLTSLTVATFKTNYQALITKAKTFGDVLLVTCVPNSNTALTPSQLAFDIALYDLADTNDVMLLDLSDRWQSYAALSASFYGDVTHPNNTGHADIANAIYNAIGRV